MDGKQVQELEEHIQQAVEQAMNEWFDDVDEKVTHLMAKAAVTVFEAHQSGRE